MIRLAFPLAVLVLAGCNAVGGTGRSVAVADSQVQPGLASCLATIGRADVAVVPDAPMSDAEIEALLSCTADRASR
ncbi:hypothetical protein [Jannaschia donghaensis]|uniref:Uncharacterized protein n=1 Tax=Jannaschia donghaensis TaxID=420998 RepID=A0A0M6YH28_9RHOB|nr:hypothetical protein [Jannaschia donghaensis]CTQ48995.1 hypothetical protein JDO7802_01003 [Jannaschia donghaensis]